MICIIVRGIKVGRGIVITALDSSVDWLKCTCGTPGENWIYANREPPQIVCKLANELASCLVILAAQVFLSRKRWYIRPPSQLINTRGIKPSPLVVEGSLGLFTDRMENHWPSAHEILLGVWVTVFPLPFSGAGQCSQPRRTSWCIAQKRCLQWQHLHLPRNLLGSIKGSWRR